MAATAVFLLLLAGLGLIDVTRVTNLGSHVLRLFQRGREPLPVPEEPSSLAVAPPDANRGKEQEEKPKLTQQAVAALVKAHLAVRNRDFKESTESLRIALDYDSSFPKLVCCEPRCTRRTSTLPRHAMTWMST